MNKKIITLGIIGMFLLMSVGSLSAVCVKTLATYDNHDPELTIIKDDDHVFDDGVHPNAALVEGSIGWFDFRVHYFDVDRDIPTVKKVYIDQQSYNMQLLPFQDDASNAGYFEQIDVESFSEGEHHFYFYFEDGKGGSARLPAEGMQHFKVFGENCKQDLKWGSAKYNRKVNSVLFTVYYYDDLYNCDDVYWPISRVVIDGDQEYGQMHASIRKKILGYTKFATHVDVPPGTHDYHFYFKDWINDRSVRFPEEGELSFEVPKSKSVNPFTNFLQKLVEKFPILEQILELIIERITPKDVDEDDDINPVEPEKPVEPVVKPIDPVVPKEPVELEPEDSVNPTDPDEPVEPIDPVEPEEPSEPIEPTDPAEPVQVVAKIVDKPYTANEENNYKVTFEAYESVGDEWKWYFGDGTYDSWETIPFNKQKVHDYSDFVNDDEEDESGSSENGGINTLASQEQESCYQVVHAKLQVRSGTTTNTDTVKVYIYN